MIFRSMSRVDTTTPAGEDLPVAEAVESTVYDIVPRGQLPVFDPSLTLKKAVVPATQLRRVNKFLVRNSTIILVAYVVGIVLRVISVVVCANIAQWTAVSSLIVQLPAVINIMFQFRLGFVVLLVRTYDFWYYLTVNVVCGVSFAWYFADWRIAIVPLMLVDVQNATLLDSFLQDFHVIVLAIWFWFTFLCGVMVVVALDAVDAVDSEVEVLSSRVHTIRLKEVLLNAIGTILVLMVRVIYRRRAALRSQRKSSERMVQSITFRWPLKLQSRTRTPASLLLGAQAQTPTQWAEFNPAKLHLQITTRSTPLIAKDIVWPNAFAVHSTWFRPWYHALVRVSGCVGLVSTPLVFILHTEAHAVHRAVAVAAIVGTAFYCGTLLLFYQRRLLQRVCYSFDFAFISLQLSLSCLCLADLFCWQLEPTLGLSCCWLWIHAVMTLDALTPVVRRLLGFHSWFQVPTLVLFEGALILLWLELFVWDSLKLRDRCFLRFQISSSHLVQLHVVPFLASRMATLALWGLRMLYRIAKRENAHDLLFIQSHVAYDALFQRRRAKRLQKQSGGPQNDPLRAFSSTLKSFKAKKTQPAPKPT